MANRTLINTQGIPILAWISTAVVLMLYFPVIYLGYVWDDWQLFINNPSLRIPELLWNGLLQPILPGTTYFRPLTLGSFAFEFAIFGVKPAISHGLNLIFHILNTFLVGLIAAKLVSDNKSSLTKWRVLVASLIYGLHPSLIEPVAWVSGRFDLMVTFFILLSIASYFYLHGWRRDLSIIIFFIMAALSKEMAVTLPILLFIFYLGSQRINATWKTIAKNLFQLGEWRLYLLLLTAGIFIIILRQAIFGQWFHQDSSVKSEFSNLLNHLAFIGQTLFFYAKMSVWPMADLNPQHPFSPAHLTPITYWMGLLTVTFGLIAIPILIKIRNWSTLMIVGWMIALLPVLNIIPLTIGGNIGHERFLTLPIVFLALSLSSLDIKTLSPAVARIALPSMSILVTAFLFISIANIRLTVPLWTNELTLWTWAYARHPNFTFVQSSYVGAALLYSDFSRADIAIEHMDDSKNPQLKAIKALYLLKKNRPAEAIVLYEDSLKTLQPPHEYLSSIGINFQDTTISRMGSTHWLYRSIYTGLSRAYLDLGKYDKALNNANIALFYAPYYPTAWMIKSFAYYGLDQWLEAEKIFAQSQRYFVPIAGEQSKDLRKSFLEKICNEPSTPQMVCSHFQNQLSGLAGEPVNR